MTESLKFTVVDAFASKPFAGNPAAVIVLPSDKTYADSTLQSIALEFNLSETAFISTSSTVSPHGEDAKHVNFGLRWFTPVSEVPICGHATLASASVLFADSKLVPSNVNEIQFSTMSGTLFARRVAGSARMELEFPVGDIVEANQDLTSQATKAVREAIKIPDAKINFVGVCDVPTYKKMVLVDIDVGLDLASLVVNAATLVCIHMTRDIEPLN
jgi:PhzF family phenazine biosynthesis protein